MDSICSVPGQVASSPDPTCRPSSQTRASTEELLPTTVDTEIWQRSWLLLLLMLPMNSAGIAVYCYQSGLRREPKSSGSADAALLTPDRFRLCLLKKYLEKPQRTCLSRLRSCMEPLSARGRAAIGSRLEPRLRVACLVRRTGKSVPGWRLIQDRLCVSWLVCKFLSTSFCIDLELQD